MSDEAAEKISRQDELRAKHRRILVYETEDHGDIIYRPPTRPEYQKLMSQLTEDKADRGQILFQFVRSCRIHPSAEAFERYLDDYPGDAGDAANELQEMATSRSKGIVKKGS